jgi:hypothetical protein
MLITRLPSYFCRIVNTACHQSTLCSSKAVKTGAGPYSLGNVILRETPCVRREFHHKGNISKKKFSTPNEGMTMSKVGKLGCLMLGAGALVLASCNLHASEVESSHQQLAAKKNLIGSLRDKTTNTIMNTMEIPGLKPEELSALRYSIVTTLDALTKDVVLEVSGTDQEVRPVFVALQGALENQLSIALQEHEVKSLTGVIHTPMPATPLCTKGEISSGLVDGIIEKDPARLFTVKARTTIIRDFLFNGGHLYVMYPKDGINKRSAEQQKIYQDELVRYQHLFDVPLDAKDIPTELVGATYFFQDNSGNIFVFAIKMTQAKDPKEVGHFGLWLGPVDHPAIQERVKAISSYAEQNGSDLFKKISSNAQ